MFKTAHKKKIATAEEAINASLFGNIFAELMAATAAAPSASSLSWIQHGDPSHHPFILQQLSKSKLELKELRCDKLRRFLNQIPKKLLKLERVERILISFFESNNTVWKDIFMLHDNDDERHNRKQDTN